MGVGNEIREAHKGLLRSKTEIIHSSFVDTEIGRFEISKIYLFK